MTQMVDAHLAVEKTAEIVMAYLATRTVEPQELAILVRDVRLALELQYERVAPGERTPGPSEMTAPVAAPQSADTMIERTQAPAVPVSDSITPDYIISLEDGAAYRSLRRHLMTKYGMTPDEYRRKWGLPQDYPMVAPNYAEERSKVAKRIGLGKRPSHAKAVTK